MSGRRNDVYLMFDIECTGTRLGHHDLIQFGAVAVYGDDLEEREAFPAWQPAADIAINLIQPFYDNAPDPEAMKVNGLNMDEVYAHGESVEAFLQRFVDWCTHLKDVAKTEKIILCGHGVVFDWSFLKLMFDSHREDWPCHYSALDLKSYYGGTKGLDFLDCSMTDMREEFRIGPNKKAHDAQADANYQLELLYRTFVKAGMIPRERGHSNEH